MPQPKSTSTWVGGPHSLVCAPLTPMSTSRNFTLSTFYFYAALSARQKDCVNMQWLRGVFIKNKHEKSSRSPGRQCKQLCWVLSKAKLNNKIIYTSLYCISNIVFNCFMSSLICAHAATDSDFPSTCTIIPFPVLISHIHFRFILILLVTFEVISHKCDW